MSIALVRSGNPLISIDGFGFPAQPLSSRQKHQTLTLAFMTRWFHTPESSQSLKPFAPDTGPPYSRPQSASRISRNRLAVRSNSKAPSPSA